MVFSGKLELETLGKLLLGCAFLVIMIVLFIGVGDSIDKNEGEFSDFVCYASNLIKHNVLGSFPSGCMEGKSGAVYIKDKDNYKSEEQVAELIDRCWWMYGSGEWDLGDRTDLKKDVGSGFFGSTWWRNIYRAPFTVDYTHICYTFSLDEDMKADELLNYMKDYKRNGKEASDITDSETYWNYIQKSSMGDGICVDTKIFDNKVGVFKKNKVYYVLFFDERHYKSLEGSFKFYDKILISGESDFGDSFFSMPSGESGKYIALKVIDEILLKYLEDIFESFKIDHCYGYNKK